MILPKGLDGFVIYYNASRVGFSYVLVKNGKVIAYSLRLSKMNEWNYPTHDVELAIIMIPLKILCHYLYWVHADMFTNNKNLQHVFTQNNLKLTERRWRELLKDINMSVQNYFSMKML